MQMTNGDKVQQSRQGPVLSEEFMGQAMRAVPEPFGDFIPDGEPDEGVLAKVGTEFEFAGASGCSERS